MTQRRLLSFLLAALLLCSMIFVGMTVTSAAESVHMEPFFGEPFQPDGVTFGRVSFLVPGNTQGLTKDAWDDKIDHNTDLILISFVKDGKAYENMTIRQVKEMLGDLALKRTCYTYDSLPNGMLRLNLVFHMDDHAKLKPSDFTAITVKAGFVWCAGSPSGISGELSYLKLESDVSFPVNQKAGITAVQTGPMAGVDGALRINFERKDSESLKAISTVDLCPSAIPGKTLGDLVTIDGVTVTDLVKKGNVARLCFYGDTLIFHIDDPAYLKKLKEQEYEITILPGFRWMNWHQDDWGNWAGSNRNNYTPVNGTLVLKPIIFTVNTADEVCIKTDGITVLPGYKDTYYVGDRIDMTTLLVSLNYATGDSLKMMLLESMVSYDFSAPGTATVYIDYEGMKATYDVTVLPVPETTAPETTAPETQTPETEATEQTEAETPVGSDSETLAPEQEAGGGCKSALLPLSVFVLAFSAFAMRKKED